MIVIGWLLGIFIYLIIGNLVVRFINERMLINIDFEMDESVIFVLGIIFPIIFIYVLVKEVSIFIYNHLFN